MKTIRIGSGAGYAGDRLEPSLELIEKGNLDYISYECLAERTIAIGQQAKLKDPTKGYNGLLEHRMEKALPLCWEHKVKLITNMGSANPQAAAQKCVEIARRHGLTGMKIACVTGDDLLELGLRGRELGDMLRFLLDYVMEYPANNRRELLLTLARGTEE